MNNHESVDELAADPVPVVGSRRASTRPAQFHSRDHFTVHGEAKRVYATKAQAEIAVKALFARGEANVRSYLCPRCQGWHVGNRR